MGELTMWKIIDWKGSSKHQKQYIIHYFEKIGEDKFEFVWENDLQDTLNLFSYATNIHVIGIYERKDIDYEE